MKREPSLSDQHWRLALRGKTNLALEDDVMKAIEDGNVWRFNILAKMDIQGIEPEALLRQAAEHGRVEIFEIIAATEKSWKKDIQEYAVTAAEYGHLELLKNLVEKYRASVNGNDSVLLVKAAANNRLDVMDYLLSKKANPVADDGRAILQAAQNDHEEAVKKLFEFDPRRTAKYVDAAIEESVSSGSDKVTLYLLEKGAAFFGDGAVFLKTAAAHGRDDLVAKLLKKGVPAGIKDNEALIECLERDHFTVAGILIAAGADINARNGKALHDAIEGDDVERVRFILENGGDPNIVRENTTPLTRAVENEMGDYTIMPLLLGAGANPESNKYEAVHAAVKCDLKSALRDFAKAARRIRGEERIEKQKELKKLFPKSYSLEDLRTKKGISGQSGLLIAAQTGKFAEVIRAASGGKAPRLMPEDVFHPDHGVDTVLSMLVRHKNLQQFFETDFWLDRPEELRRVISFLPEQKQKQVSLEGIEAAQRLRRAESRINNILPKKPKR